MNDRPNTPSVAIDERIVRAIEAVILVATEPVSAELLASILDIDVDAVEGLCGSLQRAYEEAGHGFQLLRVAEIGRAHV